MPYIQKGHCTDFTPENPFSCEKRTTQVDPSFITSSLHLDDVGYLVSDFTDQHFLQKASLTKSILVAIGKTILSCIVGNVASYVLVLIYVI